MSNVPKLLGAVGGAFALAGGGYYVVQAQEVSKLEKKKDTQEHEVLQQQSRVKRAESTIVEQDSLIKALQQQSSIERQSLKELDTQLDAARTKLKQLESQRAKRLEDVQRMESDQVRTASSLTTSAACLCSANAQSRCITSQTALPRPITLFNMFCLTIILQVKAAQRIEEAKAESIKLQQSVTTAKQALADMEFQLQAARQRMNPLNHPKVKSMLGKK